MSLCGGELSMPGLEAAPFTGSQNEDVVEQSHSQPTNPYDMSKRLIFVVCH